MGQDLREVVAAYHQAERRLRETLLGDGLYSVGAVRGEAQRVAVGNQLRALRSSFEAVLELAESVRQAHDALEGELQGRARQAARRPRKAKP